MEVEIDSYYWENGKWNLDRIEVDLLMEIETDERKLRIWGSDIDSQCEAIKAFMEESNG